MTKLDGSRLRLLGTITARTLLFRAERLRDFIGKAGFRPDQPRVPAGSPEGGQWTDEGDAPVVYVSDDPERPPDLPKNPPATIRERSSTSRTEISG